MKLRGKEILLALAAIGAGAANASGQYRVVSMELRYAGTAWERTKIFAPFLADASAPFGAGGTSTAPFSGVSSVWGWVRRNCSAG
jgi:hypothetical protein